MKKLIKKAKQARKNAYAPFSRFKVGAAIEAKDGRIFTGCNVENSTFGATCCAERTAIFKAVSEGVKAFKRIAIVTGSKTPDSPCGICRQVLNEFAPDLEVIMSNMKGDVKIMKLTDLLPIAFRLSK